MDVRFQNLWLGLFFCVVCAVSMQALQTQQADEATRKLALDIFKQLIEINTTDSVGSVTAAAEAMAKRFRDAGFPESDIQVLGPSSNDRKKNVVVRLHGSGKHKPVLLIGHLDVVEARREDWTTDPFQFVEKDGYYYGRGTQDMKDGDGILAEHGKPQMMVVDASEKLYSDYQLTVTNHGGHSSLPVPDNAIYHLADGLARLERYQFPFELTNITRAYYERMAKVATGQRAADMLAILRNPPDLEAVARLSQDPIDNSTMHTTCVATRLSGGHAN